MTAEHTPKTPYLMRRTDIDDETFSSRQSLVRDAKAAGWYRFLPEAEQKALDALYLNDFKPTKAMVGYDLHVTRARIEYEEKHGLATIQKFNSIPIAGSVAEQEYQINLARGTF